MLQSPPVLSAISMNSVCHIADLRAEDPCMTWSQCSEWLFDHFLVSSRWVLTRSSTAKFIMASVRTPPVGSGASTISLGCVIWAPCCLPLLGAVVENRSHLVKPHGRVVPKSVHNVFNRFCIKLWCRLSSFANSLISFGPPACTTIFPYAIVCAQPSQSVL